MYRSKLKNGKLTSVTVDHVVSALEDEDAVFHALVQCNIHRSFPQPDDLTPDAVKALRTTLLNGSIPWDLEDAGVNLCYKTGSLHSEPRNYRASESEVVCVIPSKIHAKYVYVQLHLCMSVFILF